MLGGFRKQMPEPAVGEIHGITVTLLLGGEQSLIIAAIFG
jgi:hypothetical protein